MLDKLELGDLIIINFENKKFVYQVKVTKKVEQTDAEYMFKNFKLELDNSTNTTITTNTTSTSSTLTLMSCWPAGMNVKRQIVIAQEIVSVE
jgi:sortase (surface protein transpeptidase)